jgi:hypothetical protein
MAHRPGQVKLEQSARDDPDMDKIMVCVGLLYPYDQKPSSRGLREATATGNRSRRKWEGQPRLSPRLPGAAG